MTKTKKILYWFFTLWLALGMVSTGAVQLLKVKAGAGALDSVTHLGYPVYVLTILGIWKMAGVVALLIPRFPLVKEWAYAGLFFAMTGAIYSHIATGDPLNDILPAILLLALTLVSRYFRPANRKVITVNQ